jgi:hypothetical protein
LEKTAESDFFFMAGGMLELIKYSIIDGYKKRCATLTIPGKIE